MKLNPFLFVLACAAMFAASCGQPQSSSSTKAPTPDENPVPAPEITEKELELESQLLAMERQAQELQREIEAERLADEKAALVVERNLLAEERETFEKTKQADQLAILAAEKAENEANQPETKEEPVPLAKPFPAKSESIVQVSAPVPPLGIAAQTAALPSADYSLFYEELAPMGSWFETDAYGYVWQPHIVLSDDTWRPYTRGRWADSDQGWVWISDEPFGWATYHYGRWAVMEGIGWVWIPGDVWAPAWVAWRNSEKYVGWCPLPPETLYYDDYEFGPTIDDDFGISPSHYTFMPIGHFGQPVTTYWEAPSTSITIILGTVNVTRLIIRPSHVHCGGPRRDFLRRFLRHDLDHYVLRCDRRQRRNHHDGDRDYRRPRIDNGSLGLFAPNVRAPWNERLRPVSEVRRLEKPNLVRRSKWQQQRRITGRFETERRRRVTLADAAVKTSLGQKVIQRQEMLSKIDRQRRQLANGGLAGRANPGRAAARPGASPRPAAVAAAETPPPRARMVQADPATKGRDRLDRAAAEVERRKNELARLRNQREGRHARVSDSVKPMVTKGSGKESPAAVPRPVASTKPKPKPAVAATPNSRRVGKQDGEPGDRNRGGRDLAAEQRQREDMKAQAQAQANARNRAAEPARKPQKEVGNSRKDQEAKERKDREALDKLRIARAGAARKEVADRSAREQKLAAANRQRQEAAARRAAANRKEQVVERAAMDQKRVAAEAAQRSAAARQRKEAAEASKRDAARRAAADRQKKEVAGASKQDAARRAAVDRQRKEAAEASKRDASRRAAAESVKRDAARRAAAESSKREAARRAAAESAKRDAARRASADRQRKESAESAKRDAARRASADRQRKEAAESAKRDAARRASADRQRKEAAESAKRDAARRASADRQRKEAAESAKRNASRRAAAESAKRDASRRAAAESAKRDAARRAAAESAKRDAARRAAADRQRKASADSAKRAAADRQKKAAADAARRAAAQRKSKAKSSSGSGKGKRKR